MAKCTRESLPVAIAMKDDSQWRQFEVNYSPLISMWLRRFTRDEIAIDEVQKKVLSSIRDVAPRLGYTNYLIVPRRWIRSVTLREFVKYHRDKGLN